MGHIHRRLLGQIEPLLLLPPSRYPAVPPAVAVEVAAVVEPAYLQVTAVEVAEHREQLRPGSPHRHNIQW